MNSNLFTIVIILVVVAIGVCALIIHTQFKKNRSRTDHLKDRFGPEYTRLANETGISAAERQLQDREKRVASLSIHELSPEQRKRFVESWQSIQAEFVENPKASLAHADGLLGEAMNARGYPVTDFDQQAADLSVDHPVVVQNYRAAHEIAVRNRAAPVSTEDMRQAMIHYRHLFEELVSSPVHAEAAE
jgi:hypothetical protein